MGEFCYCPKCQENRYVERKFESDQMWIFGILMLLGYITIRWSTGYNTGALTIGYAPAIIYLVYALTRKKQCPVCRTPIDKMEPPRIKFEE